MLIFRWPDCRQKPVSWVTPKASKTLTPRKLHAWLLLGKSDGKGKLECGLGRKAKGVANAPYEV